MPVTLRPVWQIVAVIGVGLFLVDVGVRRVRIDLKAIASSVKGLFGRSNSGAGQQLGGLKAARDAAKAKLASRGTGEGEPSPAQLEAQAREAAKIAQQTAKAKFEVAPEQLRPTKGSVILGGADAKVTPTQPKPRPTDGAPSQTTPQQPGEGMSRLLKAKQKARDDMQD
jgi:hypothetical protein